MKKAITLYRKQTDASYLIICLMLSALSVCTLLSVAQYGGLQFPGVFGNMRVVYVQILACGLGTAGAIVLSLVDYHKLIALWPIHVVLCWGLVLLTFVPGIGYEPEGTGSQSWIAMPFGMSFQPTELAKISFYITFAGHLAKVHGQLNRPKNILPVLAHLALPVLLVHFQGDDGTAIVFLAIGGIMLVMAGLNRWVVAAIAAAGAAALPFLWKYGLSQYQKDRIIGLFNPEPYADTIMYQQLLGRDAVSAGGLTGQGLFTAGRHYVPRSENDFIFSYFAESYGFIGCVLLLLLLFGLILKTLYTAANAPDRAGAYICIGVFATLLFQSVINIGMNLMLVPVMGLTFPFFSAGGTSVLMLYLSVGLVLGVGRQTRKAGNPNPPRAAGLPKR